MFAISKKHLLLFAIMNCLAALGGQAYAACTGQSPNWTCTPDYTSLDNLINHNTPSGFTYNDTINVAAGSGTETWTSHLPITKACRLIGPGASKLLITSGYSAVDSNSVNPLNFLIDYTPDATSLSGNYPFRLKGFSFDVAGKCSLILLRNRSASPILPISKVQIDNNIFYNSVFSNHYTVKYYGTIYGVIHNNVFNTINGISTDGLQEVTWNNLSYSFGSSDNFYIEDNTFNVTSRYRVVSGGYGGRYVFRYNTMNYTAGGSIQWLDAHGNQVAGVYSMMGIEVYGNKLVENGTASSVQFVDQRGGKGLVFNNVAYTDASIVQTNVREEYGDCLSPTTNPQPQHVSDSYYWNNIKSNQSNSSLVPATVNQNCCSKAETWQPNYNYAYQYCVSFNGTDCFGNRSTAGGTSGTIEPTWNTECGVGGIPLQTDGTVKWLNMGKYDGPALKENRDWYNQATTFNGTIGIGCGTLSSRSETCSIGVGYWATDQSCASVDPASAGVHPTTSIAGTFFKCTATNSWSQYFTPLSYPHPLTTWQMGEAVAVIVYSYDSSWTLEIGRTYTYSVANMNFVGKQVTKVLQEQTNLSSVGSVESVELTEGSYFLDPSLGRLYIRCAAGVDPKDENPKGHLITVNFK